MMTRVVIFAILGLVACDRLHGQLRVEVATRNREYVLGEPIIMQITWRYDGMKPVMIVHGAPSCSGNLYVRHENDEETRIMGPSWHPDTCKSNTLSAIHRSVTDSVGLLVNRSKTAANSPGELIFSKPGRYYIRFEPSVHGTEWPLSSESLIVDVTEPSDDRSIRIWRLEQSNVLYAVFVESGGFWSPLPSSAKLEIMDRLQDAVGENSSLETSTSQGYVSELRTKLFNARSVFPREPQRVEGGPKEDRQ